MRSQRRGILEHSKAALSRAADFAFGALGSQGTAQVAEGDYREAAGNLDPGRGTTQPHFQLDPRRDPFRTTERGSKSFHIGSKAEDDPFVRGPVRKSPLGQNSDIGVACGMRRSISHTIMGP